MSETNKLYSRSSSPGDSWAWRTTAAAATPTMFGDHRVSDASVTETHTDPRPHASSTINVPAAEGGGGGGGGRVSKPIRRRSRASRRTPTTLLNTDTTNFRAMVQQFTGGPGATPFAATGPHPFPGGSAGNFGFGLGPTTTATATNTVMVPPGTYYHLQYQQQQQERYYQQQQQQQQPPYMFSFMNNNSTSGTDRGDGFIQRFGNSRADHMEEMDKHSAGGFSMDGFSSLQPPPPRPPS